MDRLEAILKAEEAARHLVGDAREDAVRALKAAHAEALLVAAEAARRADDEAARIREKLVGEARTGADRILSQDARSRPSESVFEEAVQAALTRSAG